MTGAESWAIACADGRIDARLYRAAGVDPTAIPEAEIQRVAAMAAQAIGASAPHYAEGYGLRLKEGTVDLPRLTLLPGGLLGRVTGHDGAGLPRVDRWHTGARYVGWRPYGVEGRPLPAEGHPSYAAALARIGEPAVEVAP